MSLVYDPLRRRMIMYGGIVYYPHSDYVTLSDVWALELTGTPSWTRLGDGPVPYGSAGHSALYDPVRDRMVVTGGRWWMGSTISHSYGEYVAVTGLEGALAWTMLSSPAPPPEGQTIYNPVRDRLLRFGGPGVSSVWARAAADSGQWVPLGSVGPGPLAAVPATFDPRQDAALLLLTAPAAADADQVWALAFGAPTATLRGWTATSEEVELVWYSALARFLPAVLQRQGPQGDWVEICRVEFDATGRVVARDRGATPGGRYAYRLGLMSDEGLRFSDAVWVDVPARPGLALMGARPNPTARGLNVVFSLPDASRARLEVMDIAGRRILAREVGDLGPGVHALDLAPDGSVPAGVYWIRLLRADRSLAVRGVVIR
jgi:hypothetical protein